jgi:hypothetical protein
MSTPMNHNGRADRRAGSIFPTNRKESLRQQNSPAVAPLLTRQARPEVEPGVRTMSFQPTSLCKHMSSDAECKFA